MQSHYAEFLTRACRFEARGLHYEPEAALHSAATLAAAGAQLWAAVAHLKITHLLAPGSGSGPLAAAIALAAHAQGVSLAIIQLKSAARYPDRKVMHCGPAVQQGARCLLVDDCLLKGQSARVALAQAAAQGWAMVGIAVYFDELSLQGSRQLVASGTPVFSVLNRRAIGLTRDAQYPADFIGAVRWQRYGFKLHRARSCAPKVIGQQLLVADETCALWCIDMLTGNTLWRSDPQAAHPKGINNDFLVDAGVVYVTSYAGEVAAISLATGQQLWRRKIDMAIHSAPAISRCGTTLYINCESSGRDGHFGHLRAVCSYTGAVEWSMPHAALAPCQPALGLWGIYAAANDQTLLAATSAGEQLWRVATNGLVRGKVVICNTTGAVVVATETGWLQGFHPDTGALQFAYQFAHASNHLAPVQANGAWVVSDNSGHVFGIDVRSPSQPKVAWASRLRGRTAWRPSINHRSQLVFVTDAGNVAVVTEAGDKLMEQNTPHKCFAPVALSRNAIVFLTLSGELVCREVTF